MSTCTRETHPVPFTILDQLGGQRRLALMTGAKNFAVDTDLVQFDIGRGAKSSITKVVIKLNGWDLYDVTFYKGRNINLKPVSEHKGLEGIGAENLRSTFEEATGFYLSL